MLPAFREVLLVKTAAILNFDWSLFIYENHRPMVSRLIGFELSTIFMAIYRIRSVAVEGIKTGEPIRTFGGSLPPLRVDVDLFVGPYASVQNFFFESTPCTAYTLAARPTNTVVARVNVTLRARLRRRPGARPAYRSCQLRLQRWRKVELQALRESYSPRMHEISII